MSTNRDTTNLGGLVDAALEISERRRETLAQLRSAVQRGDRDDTFEIAKELCGVDDDEKSGGTGRTECADFKLQLTFDVTVNDITRDTFEEHYKRASNRDEILQDPWFWQLSQNQRRMLHVLVNNQTLLRRFVSYLVVEQLETFGSDHLHDLACMLNTCAADQDSDAANYFKVIEPAIAALPDIAEGYYLAQSEGAISEATEELMDSVIVKLTAADLSLTENEPCPDTNGNRKG